jgi:ferric-dicitrate binding protein FerR (iron transport regulator)
MTFGLLRSCPHPRCWHAAGAEHRQLSELDYTAHQRLIKLTRGEIIVTCGRADEGSSLDRPLRVRSHHGVYEGVAARFILRQEADCARLSVTSGMAAIHSPLPADGVPIQVQAGQSYVIDHQRARLAPPQHGCRRLGRRSDRYP